MRHLLLALLCCLSSLACASLACAAEPAGAPASTATPDLAVEVSATTPANTVVVGFLPLTGEMNQAKAAYFKRSIAAAQDKKLTHLVVHLTTPGGHLQAAMEMLNVALDVPQNRPRLIAFVDDHSLSAGSLIAYGHDEILVTSKAMLGDIGVITMSADGKIEYLPEKIETVVRALLRNAAQHRGWDQAKLVKMTARTQDLYRFDLPSEGDHPTPPAFVIEDDLGTFLAAHPTLKAESKVTVLGDDRLLSYTAREAVSEGMATALVADLDAVYARLGVTKEAVVDLSPGETETLSWKLAGFAPLLAAAALLFIFLEFKVPMGGMWLAAAAAAGIGFFVCQFYLDLANYLEVVLILLGIALIIVEFVVVPLAGLFAASGGLLLVVGLVLAFMPTATQFTPSAVGWGDSLISAFFQALWAIGVLSCGTAFMIRIMPRLALKTGLADAAAIEATSASDGEAAARPLLGQTGTVVAILRPAGQVDIAGERRGAVSEHGDYLPEGTPVTVVGVRFNDLVVRKLG